MADQRGASGFYCSTSGTTFTDKDAYLEHMKSDFHRYNLKRKVTGLPPVTKEWFEARKAQLASGATGGGAAAQIWIDPLTKKKFMSENTYQAYTRSKKYLELVKKSGQPAPAPLIMAKPTEAAAPVQAAAAAAASGQGAPASSFSKAYKGGKSGKAGLADMEEGDEDDEDGWETTSDEGEDTAGAQVDAAEGEAAEGEEEGDEPAEEDEAKWEQWDVRRCLFDNHMSPDMESNLSYMFKQFGFYFPDAEYLKDPEGLLKYLGCKLQYGRVALYTKGDDPNAKQFRSLHAVQRHMVDRNQCHMVYEDNEEEYEEFYDYGPHEDEGNDAAGKELVMDNTPASAMIVGGYELMLPTADGQGTKVLGTREFARYYRQRHRLEDTRQSVIVNTMLAKYRSLGIALVDGQKSLEAKKNTTKSAHDLKWEGKRNVKTEVWSNFVKQLGKGVGRLW